MSPGLVRERREDALSPTRSQVRGSADAAERSGIRCKVCGNPAAYLCDTPNEHSRTTLLHHYRCTGCGLVFVGDSFDDEELAAAYATLDPDSYYDEIRAETGRKLERALQDLAKLVPRDARIIDIGTGNGGFLERLLESGYTSIAAHEIPGTDLGRFEERGCETYFDFDYSSVPSHHFDAVTLMDVAEHVVDPRKLFAACGRILKPGGVVYFHTPVVTRVDKAMHRAQQLPVVGKLGRAWQRSRTSIFHQQNYTREAIELLLKESGFESIVIRVENELSWPVARYVRTYVCEKFGLPRFLAPVLAPVVYPLVATDLFNANKAIAWGRKTR
jgi:SAM-dependent methyltransferase